MPSLYNTPYGRGSKVVLPSDKSTSQDYCFQTSNQTNMMAWMDRQSDEIAAAFRGLKHPSLPTRYTEVAKSINRDRDDERRYHKMENEFVYRRAINQDSILEFTTLPDPESNNLTIDLQHPCCIDTTSKTLRPEDNNAGNKNDATEYIESNTKPPSLLQGMRRSPSEMVESPIQEEQQSDETRQIENHKHLFVSATLSMKLETLRISPSNPNAGESLLSPPNTEMARLALWFASNDAFKHTEGVNFATEVGLYDYAPGVSYPIINTIMKKRREDTKLQCYLAHYLLRGMLKRYGDLPFPDRVDVRGSGLQRGRLLVPYSAGSAETSSEGKRVRRRIVNEMRLEKLSTREGSELF
ncbi:hypothetical protein GGR58DRAFT_520438 [Xylaria digitata]|nr:hypothetical protein GGR58DRAFT_520438 [Xylaria digitata]